MQLCKQLDVILVRARDENDDVPSGFVYRMAQLIQQFVVYFAR